MGEELSAKEVLDMVPQQEPFRFIDEILDLRPAEYGKARWSITEDMFWTPGGLIRAASA